MAAYNPHSSTQNDVIIRCHLIVPPDALRCSLTKATPRRRSIQSTSGAQELQDGALKRSVRTNGSTLAR